ncbi:hypothetical protein C8J56DRAFT_959979 [Mycena floridula]|nr:hypothetical protein C8J56DRAFT_959979 [Mycena floridula]
MSRPNRLIKLLLLAQSALARPLFSWLVASPTVSHNCACQHASNLEHSIKKSHGLEPWTPEFYERLTMSAGLVLLGGVFAGLTLGLMGLDELHLRVLAASAEEESERRNAKKVLKLMARGRHWVLVVLLLGNVIINESLPIFLDSAIGGGFAAVAISTTAIVIFGEIIPQALSVRYGLAIGAACAPLVWFMMIILAPIAYPIARILDWALGANETHTYKKAELKSFLQFHRTGEEPLHDEEISILNGVLELGAKRIEEVMTGIDDVVTLSADTLLDRNTVDRILLSGYSRFPVHEPGKPGAFIGLLLIKKLLSYDPTHPLPISAFPLSILPEAGPGVRCFQALDYFQTGRAHLLLVSRTPGVAGGALGVVTLEDVVEEIISSEIIDETDQYTDNVSKRRARRGVREEVLRGIVERETTRRKRESITSTVMSPLSESGSSHPEGLPGSYRGGDIIEGEGPTSQRVERSRSSRRGERSPLLATTSVAYGSSS